MNDKNDLRIVKHRSSASEFNIRAIAKHYILLIKNFSVLRKIITTGQRKYFLSAAIIIKNEREYIQEWIEYHLLIGVEHFYIFDNESTDDILEVLQPYIDKGIVSYVYIKGAKKQIPAYISTMVNHYKDTNWLAILDADEFLVSVGEENIKDFLKKTSFFTSQLLLGWMVFGSSGKKHREPGLVLERFKWHASDDFIADYKPIVRPERYLRMKIPHWVDVLGKTIDENRERIWDYPSTDFFSATPAPKQKFRINHYYSKSLEEFKQKSARGRHIKEKAPRNIADFRKHDQNKEQDSLVDKEINELKKMLRSR